MLLLLCERNQQITGFNSAGCTNPDCYQTVLRNRHLFETHKASVIIFSNKKPHYNNTFNAGRHFVKWLLLIRLTSDLHCSYLINAKSKSLLQYIRILVSELKSRNSCQMHCKTRITGKGFQKLRNFIIEFCTQKTNWKFAVLLSAIKLSKCRDCYNETDPKKKIGANISNKRKRPIPE